MKGSFTQFLDPSRKIQARMKVEDMRLRFETSLENIGYADATSHDAALLPGGLFILQFMVWDGVLFWTFFTSPPDGIGRLGNYIPICLADRVAVDDKGMHLVYSHGTSVYYRPITTGPVIGSEVLLYTSPTPDFSFAVDRSKTYRFDSQFDVVAFEITDATGAGEYIGKIVLRSFNNTTPVSTTTWDGYVAMDTNTPPVIDAVLGTIFFTDHSGKRTQWVNIIPQGTNPQIFSDTGSVIPLDITDDTSFFRLTSASLGLDNLVYVTGVLSRQYGRPMTVFSVCDPYAKTEPEFTFGRDMFIKSNNTDADTEGLGKLLHAANMWVYITPDKVYTTLAHGAGYSPFVWYDERAADLSTLSTVNVSFGPNQPAQLQTEIASSEKNVEGLGAGSALSLEVCANDGSFERIGLFGVDQIEDNSNLAGERVIVRASSFALKKLNEWTSDTAYDYWSQSKVWKDAKDLTGLVRVSGQWDEADDGSGKDALYLKDLNVDGVMYTVERASNGCSMRARFMRKSGDFDSRLGLIVNYQKETMAQAAERLNVDIAKVSDDQLGRSGIFVIQSDHENVKGVVQPGVSVWAYNTLNAAIWSLIGEYQWPLNIPRDMYWWLMVNFREGNIDIYSASDALDWNLVGSCLAHPTLGGFKMWDRDTNGRAGIYLRNVTPYAASYPFASDSAVVPLDNNLNFPNADTAIVDSEQIGYVAKSANIRVGPLDFSYGKEIIVQSDTSGTAVGFADDRARNVAKQVFTLPVNPGINNERKWYVRGIKVFVGKVGYPEDGLEVRIYGGSETTASPLGTLKASATISSDQISQGGNWVFTGFYSKVEMVDGDRIILIREKDPAHPNGSHYYKTWLKANGVTGGSFWRFDEGNDWFNEVQVGGAHAAMPFKLIAYNDAPGGMGAICVDTVPALSQVAGTYLNQALIVTEGSGIGNCYQVTGYTPAADICIFYIQTTPGFDMDETSKLMVVPSLYNLTRSSPASHGASQCNIYRASPLLLVDKVGYFSKELDRSLQDYVNSVCWKAGLMGVTGEMAYPTLLVPSENTATANRRNIILRAQMPNLGANSVDFRFRETVAVNEAIILRFTNTNMLYLNTGAVVEIHPFVPPGGYYMSWVTISLYDRYLSVWLNNRLIHTFVLTDIDAAYAGDRFTVNGTHTGQVSIEFPEACALRDNYVLDVGNSGLSMVNELIGNKKFYVRDTQDGGLYLFRNRTDANTSETPYTRTTEFSDIASDVGKITRVLLEGVVVAERFDLEEIKNHGNLFGRLNVYEINNADDAKWFADKILAEYATQDQQVRMVGAAWPKLDVEDQLYVQTPGGLKHVIIDTLAMNLVVNESEASSEMEISGRSI